MAGDRGKRGGWWLGTGGGGEVVDRDRRGGEVVDRDRGGGEGQGRRRGGG